MQLLAVMQFALHFLAILVYHSPGQLGEPFVRIFRHKLSERDMADKQKSTFSQKERLHFTVTQIKCSLARKIIIILEVNMYVLCPEVAV